MKQKPSFKNGVHSMALSVPNNIGIKCSGTITVHSVRDGADQDPLAQTRRFEGQPCYWGTYRKLQFYTVNQRLSVPCGLDLRGPGWGIY